MSTEAETAEDTRSPNAIRAAERRAKKKAEGLTVPEAGDTPLAAPSAVLAHDRQLLADTDAAYEAAVAALAKAAELIEKAGNLHRASKLAIRTSMRTDGGLQFAADLPDDLGRRAMKDPEVSAAVQRFRVANANW